MIDTHCHLTFEGLRERAAAVIADARAAGVDRMISVSTTPDDGRAAAQLADRHENIFATSGIHPLYSDQVDDLPAALATMRELSAHPKVVALGELGLDKHYGKPAIEQQRRVLRAQLELIPTLDRQLPIVIHNREATDETLAELEKSGIAPERFVFHCFTGSRGELEAILAFGAMVSFTGVITFKNARDVAEASDIAPIERVMVETDAPFLTPEPHRKVRPNEPKYVPYVAQFLADRRGMDVAEFTAQVDANAERFFGLP